MINLITQYLSGDCQHVRNSLRASISADSTSTEVGIATGVADEFVSRSIANLSRLYEALVNAGYEFADPADAFALHHSPQEDSVADFEKQMGKIPLIVSRWYRRIKSVNFTQTYKQLTDRHSPLAGLGWNVPLITQSLANAREHWQERCRQREKDDRLLEAAGEPTHGPPCRALLIGGNASNCDCKGFELPSYRFDDVLYNDGGGDQYFGDEIANAFSYGGFPVLTAPERTLKFVRRLYGEPDREFLSKHLPMKYEPV